MSDTAPPDDALIDDIAAEYPDLAAGDHAQEHAAGQEGQEGEDTEMGHPGSATQEQEIHHTDLALDDDDSTTHHHHHDDHEIGVDELATGDDDGNVAEEVGALTDEALRQFANAAAMHYDLNHHEHDEHVHQHDQEDGTMTHDGRGNDEQLDPSLTQVVTGSIPPPPRPTYQQHQHHAANAETPTTTSAATTVSAAAGDKRKRDEYDPASLHGGAMEQDQQRPHQQQPIQAQADPLQHPLLPLPHRHMILPRTPTTHHPTDASAEASSPSTAGLPLALSGMYPQPPTTRGNHHPSSTIQSPQQQQQNSTPQLSSTRTRKPTAAAASASTGAGASAGRGRVRSHGVSTAAGGDEMHLTDGGGAEGSDGGAGRKEGKDERSARRAEQNRRAQQNFRKRREEAMKEQAARLQVLIPQMEEMKRQQAETQLLLEALKLENTALRAVLVQAVKKGAKILDDAGELVGASTMPALGGGSSGGNPFPLPRSSMDGTTDGNLVVPSSHEVEGTDDVHPTHTHAEEVPGASVDEDGDETGGKAIQDVYAALDRLGARTHVYARTIVPLVTEQHQAQQQQQQPQQDQQVSSAFAASHNSHQPMPTAGLAASGPSSVSSRRQTQGKGIHSHQPVIAQSSIRTAQQHQPASYPQTTSYGLSNLPNLPPFPGSGGSDGSNQHGRSNSNVAVANASGPAGVSEQLRAVEEAIAEIDPALRQVVASVTSAGAEGHHTVSNGGGASEAQGDDGQDEMMVDPSIDVSLA